MGSKYGQKVFYIYTSNESWKNRYLSFYFQNKTKNKNFDQDQYMSYDSYNGKKNS